MRFPYIVILMACVMSAATIMSVTGIGAHMGGTPNPGLEGNDETVGEEDIKSFESSEQSPDSIIGLALSAVGWVSDLIGLVVLAPEVLINLGFPPPVAVALSLPIWAMTALFLISVLRGVGIL